MIPGKKIFLIMGMFALPGMLVLFLYFHFYNSPGGQENEIAANPAAREIAARWSA